MRPISLDIEGFTSFRQPASIDFTNFDLFAITGPTGAGKTSIIDAMIYALYGCTPRISNKSISELISQGTDRLKVMFAFSSGPDEYRIARETKWTGKSSLTSVRLEQKVGDEWTSLADRVTEAEAIVEKTIGLDFKGFTKSVVLPQGQFDEFLKGRVDDRRKILSDLLQLDIYGRMMQRANEIARDHKNKLDTLGDLLSRDYASATRENLAALRKKSKELKPLLKPLESQISNIRSSIPIAVQLRQNRNELTEHEATLKKLVPQRMAAEKRLASAQEAIDESKKKIQALDVSIKSTIYNSTVRDDLLIKLHRAERLNEAGAAILNLEKAHKKKSERLAELRSLSAKAEATHEVAAGEKSAVEKEVSAGRNRLNEDLGKYGSADAITNVIEVNRRRIQDEQRKSKIEKELNQIVTDQHLRTEKLSQQRDVLAEVEKRLEAAKSELESLVQKHAAAELQHTLEKGKPCPVCEQEVQEIPKTKRHPSIDQTKKGVKACEKHVNELLRTTASLEGELRQTEPQLTGKRQEIAETEQRISKAAEQLSALLGKSAGPDSEAELEALRKHISDLQKTLEAAIVRLDKSREIEAAAKDEASRLKGELTVVESEISGSLQHLNELHRETETLRKELARYSDLSVVKKELEGQNKAKEEYEENRRRRDGQSEKLLKARDEFTEGSRLRESLSARDSALKETCERLTRAINENTALLVSGFPDLKVDVLGPKGDAAIQLDHQLKDLESRHNSAQTELVRLEQQVRQLQEQVERATEIRAEMEIHKSQAAVARDLGLALRGDQFIAFIQEEAYRRLAVDGSVHLESLSSERYSFDFDRDEFVVVDHWNADEPRPVATLSGGESFLASLALALALAEGLSGLSYGRGRFALESLFLDEGFGSLDPDTLDVVMQGIETLGSSDRLVAIISHIPELAERLPGRISVRKAVGGSSIELS